MIAECVVAYIGKIVHIMTKIANDIGVDDFVIGISDFSVDGKIYRMREMTTGSF